MVNFKWAVQKKAKNGAWVNTKDIICAQTFADANQQRHDKNYTYDTMLLMHSKKPVRPNAPHEPVPPLQEIDDCRQFTSHSLTTLWTKVKQQFYDPDIHYDGPSAETFINDVITDCYAIDEDSYEMIFEYHCAFGKTPNPKYRQQSVAHEKLMKQYESALTKYNELMKKYELEISLWNKEESTCREAWETKAAQEKESNDRALFEKLKRRFGDNACAHGHE